MFHLFTGLIALYVIWRLVWRMRWPRAAKWIVAALVLLASKHHLITSTFFGTMASPEVPYGVLLVLGWAFGALLIAASLVLIADLAALGARILKQHHTRRQLVSPAVRGGIGIVAMVLAAIGVAEAVRVPDVRTVEVEVAGLPAQLDGFRLLQLTDLHASRLAERPWIEAVVQKANAAQADMIVITGDLVDGTVSARKNDVAPLADLKAPLGVYAIPGNHEYYQQYSQWLSEFERLGLHVLKNEHTTITRGDASFILAGTTDAVAQRFNQTLPDIDAALAGVPPEAPIILMAHRPLGAEKHARAGVDLQLSGHTHGGQVLGMHWVTQIANDGYVSGMYDVDGMKLYVSNGTGLWPGFPVRLGKRSEITEFILRAPKAGAVTHTGR